MTTHDGSAAGSRRVAVRDREDAVVERLRALGSAMDGEPDPAFRTATRARLVAMAAVRSPEPVPATRSVWHRLLSVRAQDAAPARWRGRLTAGLAAAALAVTAVATLVAVSSGARPGDVLYGLKRGTEQTQLALAGDSRGRTLLDFASTRLTELGDLTGGGNATLAVSTLKTMDQQATEGAAWLTARALQTRSTAPADELAAWAGGQHDDLAALQPRLPTAARAEATRSLDLLTRIDTRAAAVSSALTCAAGPATSGTDALGPVPAGCSQTSSPNGGGTGTAGTPPEAGTGTPAVPSTGAGNASTPGSGNSTAGPAGTTGSGALDPGTQTVVPTTPTTPPLINLPLATPPVPLPGSGAPAGSTGSGSTPTSGAPGGQVGVCLPPLVTIGTC